MSIAILTRTRYWSRRIQFTLSYLIYFKIYFNIILSSTFMYPKISDYNLIFISHLLCMPMPYLTHPPRSAHPNSVCYFRNKKNIVRRGFGVTELLRTDRTDVPNDAYRKVQSARRRVTEQSQDQWSQWCYWISVTRNLFHAVACVREGYNPAESVEEYSTESHQATCPDFSSAEPPWGESQWVAHVRGLRTTEMLLTRYRLRMLITFPVRSKRV
jgi:hypothetical protein